MLNCPKCNRIMLDATSDGGMKLRSRMVLFNADGAYALCPTCKTNVQVPLSLDSSNLPPSKKPFYYVQT